MVRAKWLYRRIQLRTIESLTVRTKKFPYLNVTSGGIRCNKGTPIIKKPNPSLFIKGGTTKEGKKTSLDTEQIYSHGFQWGSMPGVTVLAGCRQ
jgi:hypothetical protein